MWNLSLATLLGLGLGVCLAFIQEFWNASIRSTEELQRLTAMPALGAIPRVGVPAAPNAIRRRLEASIHRGIDHIVRAVGRKPNGSGRAAVVETAQNERAQAEAIRHVCASILLSQSGQPPQTMMVTSAVTGEGKSTLARHISKALSEVGARTLLVECDLRRPTLQAAEGIAAEAGLTLYLSGHGSFPLIHSTNDPNLCLVTAGPPAPNPPALLGSERMQAFLAWATAEFRFIILDAPPVLPVADARVLAPLTDGVILVVRSGTTPRRAVRRVAELLEQAGTRVLGTVLNATDRRDANVGEYEYYSHASPYHDDAQL
jgi:capsular exopolysaccharide synthesis family protein